MKTRLIFLLMSSPRDQRSWSVECAYDDEQLAEQQRDHYNETDSRFMYKVVQVPFITK